LDTTTTPTKANFVIDAAVEAGVAYTFSNTKFVTMDSNYQQTGDSVSISLTDNENVGVGTGLTSGQLVVVPKTAGVDTVVVLETSSLTRTITFTNVVDDLYQESNNTGYSISRIDQTPNSTVLGSEIVIAVTANNDVLGLVGKETDLPDLNITLSSTDANMTLLTSQTAITLNNATSYADNDGIETTMYYILRKESAGEITVTVVDNQGARGENTFTFTAVDPDAPTISALTAGDGTITYTVSDAIALQSQTLTSVTLIDAAAGTSTVLVSGTDYTATATDNGDNTITVVVSGLTTSGVYSLAITATDDSSNPVSATKVTTVTVSAANEGTIDAGTTVNGVVTYNVEPVEGDNDDMTVDATNVSVKLSKLTKLRVVTAKAIKLQ
jgi:hypothetical protein